jgi:hypothetical protein
MHGEPPSPKTRYTAAKRTLREPKKMRRTSVGKRARYMLARSAIFVCKWSRPQRGVSGDAPQPQSLFPAVGELQADRSKPKFEIVRPPGTSASVQTGKSGGILLQMFGHVTSPKALRLRRADFRRDCTDGRGPW